MIIVNFGTPRHILWKGGRARLSMFHDVLCPQARLITAEVLTPKWHNIMHMRISKHYPLARPAPFHDALVL